jgi:hypothetical protein
MLHYILKSERLISVTLEALNHDGLHYLIMTVRKKLPWSERIGTTIRASLIPKHLVLDASLAKQSSANVARDWLVK